MTATRMKKYMQSISRVAVCGAVMLSAFGCSDYLEEVNKSNFTQGSYFTSASQAQSAIDGLYAGLRMFNTDNGYGERPWVSLELINGHASTLGQSFFNSQFINQTADAANPPFRTIWQSSYNTIGSANLAIQRIPSISMDESQKKSLLGQAYFMRAFFYYHLVRLYGDVPLITTPIDASSADLYPARSPQEDVYKLIVSDLTTAEQAGLPVSDQTGRITVGAVKSLLSSVYLTMAGYPLQKTENYALAAAKAKEVIDSKVYPLFTSYEYLHDNAHKNQGELILQAQYATGIATNSISALVIPYFARISVYGDEYGAIIPTEGFYNTYEPGDLRAQERQFYFTQYPSISDTTQIVKFGVHALYKYFHKESALNRNVNTDENWTLLRLPEVMLIYAEASNEVSGPTQLAYDQVNAIRARAQLKPLTGLSKDQFREAIWKERYHELAYENKAYFDTQRTRKVYDVVNNRMVDAIGFKNESGATFTEKYLLWGLPQYDINNNKKLTQNPGW
ncbi:MULTISPECIES: RagB/SusD family nutrient uptake outer membrane protein [Spirosoma]|uniref:RagB/SusD family nutrient uptake outer membrane protein n=1 Tax=Spirosoma liriopis TaxID=2937440 RepID=A0ABT0HFX0_9BACT|nr:MULTISPECIES: RagB/SusD family nutrient uptake outer membrane protein [Spirosoma]MCK8491056.1 RagB/SusD family nutrient uptake outer membrane protein [Spirosoma liriopis]UHG90439.1 RagB/SusD family nutrient uptake outer membrane protein [Spirosoma oryzicola]